MAIIKIHNVESGEVIERQMTSEELTEYELRIAAKEEEKQAQAQAQAKREAALLKLAALGLTADDLKALGL